MPDAELLAELPFDIEKAEQLPSPPSVALAVLEVADDDDATLDDLAAVVCRDPALSVKIVKLANSVAFRRGMAVASVQEATRRLGGKTVKLMALGFSLAGALPRKGEARFDYFGFWSRSLTTAVAGRALARLVGNAHQDEAFLCGLLSRLGQLVMAGCIPKKYGWLVERAEGELPSAELEAQKLGYDFHRVGAAVLRSWQLPETVWRCVAHWDDPDGTPEALGQPMRQLARLVHLADQIATGILSAGRGTAFQRLHELGARGFGLSADELDALVVGLEPEVTELGAMLNVDLDHDSYQSIVDRARQEILEISLGTAADLVETSSRNAELERENEELDRLATTDALTGIPNRNRFERVLERMVEARLSGGGDAPGALGVLMVDVDHFKDFNDTWGHPVGDEVLKLVARTLAAQTRSTDVAARYGGEEFVVVLPNADGETLRTIGERIRKAIEDVSLPHDGQTLAVTASVGGACVERIRSSEDGEALLARADVHLYEAKRTGRNRSVCRAVELGG